jgi:hypothetical protein
MRTSCTCWRSTTAGCWSGLILLSNAKVAWKLPLAKELYELLQQQVAHQESSVRFINLNQRSLVGGLKSDSQSIGNDFLHNLLDHLFGGDDAPSIWQPCENCTAKTRCEVYRATRVFGPASLHKDENQGIRERARERLFQALQAVHLRGETHITVRELRAALAYIVFGVHYCKNYHSELELNPLPYWDRAFFGIVSWATGRCLARTGSV